MKEPENKSWLRTALLFGIAYGIVGITFGEFAGLSTSNEMRVAWRWAAWLVSAVVFAIQIGHEHFRSHNPARSIALHASTAAAMGAFVLAVAANVHELLANPANHRLLLLLSLVLWPILTAVPAFVVALTVAGILARMRPRIWLRSTMCAPYPVAQPDHATSGGPLS